jgi:hypothetical protein
MTKFVYKSRMTEDADGCTRLSGAPQVGWISALVLRLISGLVEWLIGSVNILQQLSPMAEKAWY